MDEPIYVIGTPETTGGGPREFDPKTNFVKGIVTELERVRGFDIATGKSEANQMYNLPGAEHLNPKLTAAVIVFRYKTKSKPFSDLNPKTRNTHMQTSLNHFFPGVKGGTKKYMLLKGDMIRYITLIEKMKRELMG